MASARRTAAISAAALVVLAAEAFAPVSRGVLKISARPPSIVGRAVSRRTGRTTTMMVLDPHVGFVAPTALLHTLLLADAGSLVDGAATTVSAAVSGDAVASATPVVEAATQATTQAAAAATTTEAASSGGWFDGVVGLIESAIQGIHGVLGEGSYGAAIILFTLIVKAVTFPLNKSQIESTSKMQQLQPAVKSIQARYANDPQQMNLMLAELYQENNLNPLAGCLPALVQIPIFIALYRALLNLAKADKLEESFLWLPNLEGPVYGAQNADWLFNFADWNGSTPPLGWHDTLAYLSLPLFLVVAQSISSQLLTPPTDPNNEAAQTSNAVLKFLPFMVGFFSLNVPSSLCLYWIVNNVVTTATTLLIRQAVQADQPVTMGGAGITAQPPPKKARKQTPEPASFDDMLAAAQRAQQSPAQTKSYASRDADAPVATPTTVIDVEATEIPEATPALASTATATEEPTKTAVKKRSKAVKTRRAKKSRRK